VAGKGVSGEREKFEEESGSKLGELRDEGPDGCIGGKNDELISLPLCID